MIYILQSEIVMHNCYLFLRCLEQGGNTYSGTSGGTSELQEPGHFKLRKTSNQVTPSAIKGSSSQ